MNTGRERQACREDALCKACSKELGAAHSDSGLQMNPRFLTFKKRLKANIKLFSMLFCILNFILKTQEFCGQSLEILLYQGQDDKEYVVPKAKGEKVLLFQGSEEAKGVSRGLRLT